MNTRCSKNDENLRIRRYLLDTYTITINNYAKKKTILGHPWIVMTSGDRNVNTVLSQLQAVARFQGSYGHHYRYSGRKMDATDP